MRPTAGRRTVARLLLAVALWSLAACGSQPPAIDVQFPEAPAQVRARPTLPFCGIELVGRGGPVNLVARKCFWDAYSAGQPAEFITTRPAADGSPLIVIFRSLGEGATEFFVDESAIKGSRSWTWTSCEGLMATVDPAFAIDWVPGTPDAPCDRAILLE